MCEETLGKERAWGMWPRVRERLEQTRGQEAAKPQGCCQSLQEPTHREAQEGTGWALGRWGAQYPAELQPGVT